MPTECLAGLPAETGQARYIGLNQFELVILFNLRFRVLPLNKFQYIIKLRSWNIEES